MKKWISILTPPTESGLYVAACFKDSQLKAIDTNYYFINGESLTIRSNGIYGGLELVTHYMPYNLYKELIYDALEKLPKD